MPSIKRIAVRAAAAVMAGVMLMSSVAYADEPYDGYNYDWWEDPVPSQNGYVVDRVVNGADIGIGDFKEPEDMFISDDQLIYIADTAYITPANDGKGRIVVTDSDFNLVATIFGDGSLLERIIYILVGVAGLFNIFLLFKDIKD